MGRGSERIDQVRELSAEEVENGFEDREEREDYLSHWGWLMTAYRLAGDDFTKMEQIFSMTAIEFLNYCSMRKDIQNQELSDLKQRR